MRIQMQTKRYIKSSTGRSLGRIDASAAVFLFSLRGLVTRLSLRAHHNRVTDANLELVMNAAAFSFARKLHRLHSSRVRGMKSASLKTQPFPCRV